MLRSYSGMEKSRWRARGWRFVAIFLASVVIAIVRYWPSDVPEEVNGVARIIDGDSIRIDGEEIRLVGIDAPEGRQKCQRDGQDWSCGKDASRALGALLRGARITCAIEGMDKYDRLLGTCFKGGQDINAWMVEQGWAVAYGDYNEAERQARRAGRGIWASEFDRPQDWRDEHLSGSVAAAAS